MVVIRCVLQLDVHRMEVILHVLPVRDVTSANSLYYMVLRQVRKKVSIGAKTDTESPYE